MTKTIILFSWLVLALLFKISSTYSFFAGLMILFISFLSIILGYPGFGSRVTTYAFAFFVIGVFSYILEIRRSDDEKA